MHYKVATRRHSFIVLAFQVAFLTGCLGAMAAEHDSFDSKVAPLLSQSCLSCHNADEQKGGLDLSSREAAMRGGDSGPAISAGDAEQSLLWERIQSEEMPPEHPLDETEKTIVKSWIDAGAIWGTDPIDAFAFSNDRRAGRDWWSLQPLGRPLLPASASPETHPIDAFVEAKLAEKNLARSPAVSSDSLLRRASYSIRGLPPSADELASVRSGEETYEELIRRWLNSPQYGEHWARHWLDVARYGESDGFEYDRMRPHAWRYRDWVINAFNDDMPYLRFAQLQIAGDVLEPDNPTAITATGFLVCGAYDGLKPQVDLMRQIMRQDVLEDFVGTVGQTFLGLTINCARCHDHKFDPITQREYYQMTAAFAGVNHGERDIPAQPNKVNKLNQEIESRREKLRELEAPIREKLSAGKSDSLGPNPIAAWDFTESNQDLIGQLHAAPQEPTERTEFGVKLNGSSTWLATPALPETITTKTLEAWVALSNLDQQGGAAISLQTLDGVKFDAIVFGEREARRWMSGSNGFVRTSSFSGEAETESGDTVVHVVITYAADGTITCYRNGQLYGNPYKASHLENFAAGNAQVIFGLRHGPTSSDRLLAGTLKTARIYDRVLTAEEVASSASNQPFISTQKIVEQLSTQQQKLHTELKQELDQLLGQQANLKGGKVYAANGRNPGVTHLLGRGSPLQKGDAVPAGGIAAVQGLSADFEVEPNASDEERRRQMADWVASENNPLFARVIVNRIWHHHFGRGLVATPNDFGFNGGQASHPQLLDWLASELIAQDWSLKELHYQILCSDTYRQSSAFNKEAHAVDANNQWLWRFSPRRLTAEEIRDSVLQAAGFLNRQVGGPPFQDVRPYLHRGAQFYEAIDPEGPEFSRRSIYRMWARGGRNPLLDAFDCPDPSATAPQRAMTTTPIQALTMLNSPFMMRMADEFSARISERHTELGEQVEQAYRDTFVRPPTSEEKARAQAFAQEHSLAALCRVLLNSNEFLHLD